MGVAGGSPAVCSRICCTTRLQFLPCELILNHQLYWVTSMKVFTSEPDVAVIVCPSLLVISYLQRNDSPSVIPVFLYFFLQMPAERSLVK